MPPKLEKKWFAVSPEIDKYTRISFSKNAWNRRSAMYKD